MKPTTKPVLAALALCASLLPALAQAACPSDLEAAAVAAAIVARQRHGGQCPTAPGQCQGKQRHCTPYGHLSHLHLPAGTLRRTVRPRLCHWHSTLLCHIKASDLGSTAQPTPAHRLPPAGTRDSAQDQACGAAASSRPSALAQPVKTRIATHGGPDRPPQPTRYPRQSAHE